MILKFKKGDIIICVRDQHAPKNDIWARKYTWTCRQHCWIGQVTRCSADFIEAKTISSDEEQCIGKIYENLCNLDFETINGAEKRGLSYED